MIKEVIIEIVNMSDKYTFKTSDIAAANAATLALGRGQYMTKFDGDEDLHLPAFVFGGDPEEWFKQTHNERLGDILDDSERVVAVLDTILIGDREDYERTLPLIAEDKRQEFIDDWNDRNRSSMNDIGSRARSWADKLRGKAAS